MFDSRLPRLLDVMNQQNLFPLQKHGKPTRGCQRCQLPSRLAKSKMKQNEITCYCDYDLMK